MSAEIWITLPLYSALEISAIRRGLAVSLSSKRGLKYLQHPDAKKWFNGFNDAKIRTTNFEAFEKLDLANRFVWEIDTLETLRTGWRKEWCMENIVE
jgi:hypothetical protein